MNIQIAQMFKTLGDPKRIEILNRLAGGETCGCTLIDNLDITQPTLSHHLKVLSNTGLTRTNKVGNRIHQKINFEAIDTLIEYLNQLKSSQTGQKND